jgi:ASC-1-like (ASCH) protein
LVRQVVFRIRRIYFEAIKKGIQRIEHRAGSPYWRNMFSGKPTPDIAIFLCGREVHRRKIVDVTVEDSWRLQHISEQGRRDLQLDKYQIVYAIWLGEPVA